MSTSNQRKSNWHAALPIRVRIDIMESEDEMKHSKERRVGRLFPFPVGGKWWVLAGSLILLSSFHESFQSFWEKQTQENPTVLAKAADEIPQSVPFPEPGAAVDSASQMTPEIETEIENLFAEIQKQPENRKGLLLSLKKLLQQTFEGQEDCWSCEGTSYFDRFEQIAGAGEARKPLGLREWIELGDEAFEKGDHSEARKLYTRALEVSDERDPAMEETIDLQAVARARDRCAQLQCP